MSADRPIRYLASAKVSKEDIARNIAVEHLHLQRRVRKCLFLYQYAIHPVFGFLNARIQTWFPFSIQICMNGREWLAHQIDQAGLAYAVYDQNGPKVVNINSLAIVNTRTGPATRPNGVDSGFVYDADAHIVTHDYVVQDASQLLVTFQDGIARPAELVGPAARSRPAARAALRPASRPSHRSSTGR
jgi:hypothetical protein